MLSGKDNDIVQGIKKYLKYLHEKKLCFTLAFW